MKKLSAFCAAVMLCAALSACTSARGGAKPAQTTVTTAAATTSAAKTTVTTTRLTTTSATTASTSSSTASTASTGSTSETSAVSSASAAPNPDGKAVKILWSERGLEARPGDSKEGYGEPLTAGSEYLDWKLESYDGTASGNAVSELNADFSRKSALSANGIVTVLPSTHAEYAGKLSLRVDNQSDFPYFPADSRERGHFVIENTDEVWKMLKEENPPADGSFAVSVSIEELHIHLGGKRSDTIKVSAASKR